MISKSVSGIPVIISLFLAIGSLYGQKASGQTDATIRINMAHPGYELSEDMYGIFFEDINHAADGGLYAELIRNRDFETNRAPEDMRWLNDSTVVNRKGWKEKYARPGDLHSWSLIRDGGAIAAICLEKEHPLNKNNSQSMRFVIDHTGNGRAAVANDGYWGIPVKRGADYLLSLYARKDKQFTGTLTATLESSDGKIYASQQITGIESGWKQFHAVLTAGTDDPNARFVLSAGSTGTVWLDVISLFPGDTWNNRPNGLRKDLVQKLADLNPSFLRFPGGCVVEGATLENRVQWKRTIGDVASRPGHWNLWGYRATDGLGFHEFLQLCEDLHAAPLYVVNAGMSCQGRGGMVAAKREIRNYLQDALDALEYAMGPVTSTWGAMRQANGHPDPFVIKYVEVGNENCGPDYRYAYKIIREGIKAKYPEVITVANDVFSLTDQSRKPLPGMNIEMTDEHFYASADYFYEQSARYDAFDRSNPWKVYIGEFAVTAGKPGTGNLRAALGESAFMVGMERNADIVRMASYAPTFVNVNDRKWTVDLVAYNTDQVYGTPSYHAISMFSNNRPERVLPTGVLSKTDSQGDPWSNLTGGIALRVWNGQAEFKELQVVNEGKVLFDEDFSKGLGNWSIQSGTWKVAGGILKNEATDAEAAIHAGDPVWHDYALTLKARKISGSEGFFIDFLVNGNNRCVWNLGAWNNVADLLWQDRKDTRVDAGRYLERSLEAGRWYDLRIEVKEHRVRCFLDGKLIRDELLKGQFAPSLYATSGVSKQQDELIVKIVNPFSGEKRCAVELSESQKIQPDGTAIILASESQDDENSFADPGKIAPREIPLRNLGNSFEYVCPPNSLSVLRLKIRQLPRFALANPDGYIPAKDPPVLTVRADQPGHRLNPTQYGVFFEEINHAGEGGLYAELIRNRSFEDRTDSIPGWTLYTTGTANGTLALETDGLLNPAQSRALRVEVRLAGIVGVANEGYWGIHVVKGRTYNLSFFAKSALPENAIITAKLQNKDGSRTYASLVFGNLADGWKKYAGTLTADDNESQGRLVLEITSGKAGTLWLDVVSLFPPTWKGRANGTRPDLAEMIAQMKPGVIRFPGGTYTSTLPANSPKWLTELGPVEDRPGHPAPGAVNPWGYHNNDGFGFHEYLQFAEDLGAEPIYVFQGGADPRAELSRQETYLAGEKLDKLIQDILNGIEYANGSPETTWGKKRAANGHPEPFGMKYVQIGNENLSKPFHDNYIKIHHAIKEKYPEIQVIWGGDWIGNNQHGYMSDGIMPEGSAAQLVDEHYYKEDNWFYENTDRFNPRNYPRGVEREAKVFLGEVSAVKDNLEGALKETAFLLGAEKYSDKVVMAVYAPLFANVNFTAWPANAINFDNARAFGTPSYHSQVMLANNTGDFNIGVDGTGGLLNGRLYANANQIAATGEIILKIVNPGREPLEIRIDLTGMVKPPVSGFEILMSGSELSAGNSFDKPLNVAPVRKKLESVGNSFFYVVQPYSFTILRLTP